MARKDRKRTTDDWQPLYNHYSSLFHLPNL